MIGGIGDIGRRNLRGDAVVLCVVSVTLHLRRWRGQRLRDAGQPLDWIVAEALCSGQLLQRREIAAYVIAVVVLRDRAASVRAR